jgi:peptidoglycan/xylan/chitin deacetylase (PgdA/CDA1 family)
MKTHGDQGWIAYPSYFDIVVPRVLRILDESDLKITFFIVGQDAALEKNQDAIQSIVNAGHEIGNHSYNHEPWMHLYPPEQIDDEIQRAEEVIERVTNLRPIGYRGPGYSLSQSTIEVLERRNYLYDASLHSTFLGPIARMYYFFTARLSTEEQRQRSLLFGKFSDGFRPNYAYRWKNEIDNEQQDLIEIPVTTIPILKIPFHVSYLLFISNVSPVMARLYFRFALTMCKFTSINPSLLLHPLDFLGYDEIKSLSFFPAMNIPTEIKIDTVRQVLRLYSEHFEIVPMRQHAKMIETDNHVQDISKFFKPIHIV